VGDLVGTLQDPQKQIDEPTEKIKKRGTVRPTPHQKNKCGQTHKNAGHKQNIKKMKL